MATTGQIRNRDKEMKMERDRPHTKKLLNAITRQAAVCLGTYRVQEEKNLRICREGICKMKRETLVKTGKSYKHWYWTGQLGIQLGLVLAHMRAW
jgi:hypothetical protein